VGSISIEDREMQAPAKTTEMTRHVATAFALAANVGVFFSILYYLDVIDERLKNIPPG
jgi:hypothetical protein